MSEREGTPGRTAVGLPSAKLPATEQPALRLVAQPRSSLWAWAAFAAILALYILSALRLRPIAKFGFDQDDALYFSSAKAVADGQGYILPGFPGRLPSMKYPELYPLLLAGVWKIDPHFPGNVAIAVGITLGFGCLALLVMFLMLRRWPELGDWPALAMVLLVGLSPRSLYLSSAVLSDIPFMVLMFGAAWLTELSLAREDGGPAAAAAAAAGLLAGVSVDLRSLGIPVAVGLGLLMLWRRELRRLFWFCLTGLPLTLYGSWPAVSAVLGLRSPAVVGDPTRSGWTQTVCFFSSYACEWRMDVPNIETFRSVIWLNLRYVTQFPGKELVSPLGANAGLSSLVLVMLLSVAAYVGVARSWRWGGCRPLHAILAPYLLVVLMFPFDPGRYMLDLFPLFLAGLWIEGKRLWTLVSVDLRQCQKRDERVAAWALRSLGLALAAIVIANYAYAVPRLGAHHAELSEAMARDEGAALVWIRQHATPNARVVARAEGLAYLSTGRPAAPPIQEVTWGYFLNDPSCARRDAWHLADVARHVRASFWLATPYDYLVGTEEGQDLLFARQHALLAAAPVVYRSADGWVTLYDTRCLFGALPANECAAGTTGNRGSKGSK